MNTLEIQPLRLMNGHDIYTGQLGGRLHVGETSAQIPPLHEVAHAVVAVCRELRHDILQRGDESDVGATRFRRQKIADYAFGEMQECGSSLMVAATAFARASESVSRLRTAFPSASTSSISVKRSISKR